ncbi:hypothetical protein [Mobilicoccus caccae]|uniref:hypothetical protein n=1 Tax=Mobilicoccus caccae TaxID=1859295 RepID=UPI0024E0DBFB|nr:hypothetical protein [Mobilicoccus caccae]
MAEQISVAVIGAGMAGRSHAAAYRTAGTLWGDGLPRSVSPRSSTPTRSWAATPPAATASRSI